MSRYAPSVVLLLALALIALLAPLITPYPPNRELGLVALKSLPPSFAHPMGTDLASRDVLSRVLFGARVSLFVATAVVTLMLCVGTVYGAIAAMAGGVIDALLVRMLDVATSIPRLLVLVTIAWLWSPLSIAGIVLVLGLTGWYEVARIVRGELRGQLSRDYVLAARAGGVTQTRLLLRHLLPHLAPTLFVTATLGVAQTLILEAGLGYLGLGVPSPNASWGSIISDGSNVVFTAWWLTLFPGLAIVLAVLACNGLGDALRDRFALRQVHA